HESGSYPAPFVLLRVVFVLVVVLRRRLGRGVRHRYALTTAARASALRLSGLLRRCRRRLHYRCVRRRLAEGTGQATAAIIVLSRRSALRRSTLHVRTAQSAARPVVVLSRRYLELLRSARDVRLHGIVTWAAQSAARPVVVLSRRSLELLR